MKKLLTIDDLVKFVRENNYSRFSSNESGYKLAVQVPATFEIDDTKDDDHRGMMRLKIKVFHTGLNRNGSYVSEDAAKNAMPTIKNRPLMAYIHKRDDGEYDFEAHNMTIETDENGNEYIEYQEKQIGSFDETPPFFEYDEEMDKTYVCAYAYVSEGYTRACDIIRRKNGSKNSCELDIEELAYNAKDNYLDLQKFYVAASTLLGSTDSGEEIGEGMLGSRADIVDFSQENNSIVFNKSEFVKEITQAVIKQLGDNKTAFNADNNSTRKEEPTTVFEKLLEKYNKTEADITFEYEGLSDEELEALFKEHFATKKKKKGSEDDDSNVASEEEGNSSGENQGQDTTNTGETNTNTGDNTGDTNGETGDTNGETGETNGETGETSGENTSGETGENANGENNGEETGGDNSGENGEENPDANADAGSENFTKTFELSHSDIRSGLYALLEPYEVEDNEWYWITAVYDDHFIYEGWSEDKIFDQKYSKDGDNIKFEGERVHLNREYLTDSELVALNEMRSNYSLIQSKLASYEAEPQKMEILEADCYAQISNLDAFKELAKQENHFSMSVEDVQTKADELLLAYAKGNKVEFSTKTSSMKVLPINKTKASKGKSRYGGTFSKSED